MKSDYLKTDAQKAGTYIRELIQSGENQHLDFKFEISDAKKIARTFSAFANSGGGKILIGVKDNGRISGISTEEEIYMAESAAHLNCNPPVNFTYKKWFIDGRVVLEIDIPVSESRPHYARNESGEWIAYVRANDQTLQANRILVDYWENEGRKKGVFLNYGREQKILMSYLAENGNITLSKFIKIARTGRLQAEKILVDLMLLKVITMDISEGKAFYRLNSQKS